jgi:hypothetical protein
MYTYMCVCTCARVLYMYMNPKPLQIRASKPYLCISCICIRTCVYMHNQDANLCKLVLPSLTSVLPVYVYVHVYTYTPYHNANFCKLMLTASLYTTMQTSANSCSQPLSIPQCKLLQTHAHSLSLVSLYFLYIKSVCTRFMLYTPVNLRLPALQTWRLCFACCCHWVCGRRHVCLFLARWFVLRGERLHCVCVCTTWTVGQIRVSEYDTGVL